MKERQLMTSFFLANVSDLATTAVAKSIFNATELNPFVQDMSVIRNLLQVDNDQAIVIAKLAVTTAIIGLYALSQESKSRFKLPTERGLKMVNVIVWSVVCWNAFNIGAELLAK